MIEIFTARGSNYDVGFQIGNKFGSNINEFFEKYKPLHQTFIPFMKSTKGAEIYNEFYANSNLYFPNYIKEIQGYATGSKVPFYYFFLFLLRVEIMTLIYGDPEGFNDCSDVFLYNSNQSFLLGHNEDMDSVIKGKAYIINCEINDEQGKVAEKYLAYSYPGHLPGNCMGLNLNKEPIIITMNGLSALNISIKNSTPRGILCRAVIGGGDSFEAIQKILYDKGRGSAVGFSVNVATNASQNNSFGIKMFNIEVYPNLETASPSKKSYLSILEITKSQQFYFHFNKYEHTPNILEIPKNRLSSIHRQKAALAYVDKNGFNTKHDVLNVMGETSDPKYPIYRKGFSKDTLASGVFDMNARTWEIYEGNPKFTKPIHILEF